MTEAELKHMVLTIAYATGWAVFHMAQVKPYRPARKSGSSGYPDLTLARDREVLWIELKQDGEDPDPAQRLWLEALPAAHVIRPRDLDSGRVMELLA